MDGVINHLFEKYLEFYRRNRPDEELTETEIDSARYMFAVGLVSFYTYLFIPDGESGEDDVPHPEFIQRAQAVRREVADITDAFNSLKH